MKPDPDQTLLQRVGAGDPGAFSEFYDLTSARVFGLIVTLIRSRQDAEDVLQETFVQVWNSAEKYDPALGSPMTWLLMIARSRSIDRLRKTRRDRERAELSDGVIGDGAVARDAAANDEAAMNIGAVPAELLSALPREQHDALTLAFYRGMTREEIAHALGVPVGTVKTRIRTAMTTLRESMSGSIGRGA